eukprot:2118089-Amphidinium_carterae.1
MWLSISLLEVVGARDSIQFDSSLVLRNPEPGKTPQIPTKKEFRIPYSQVVRNCRSEHCCCRNALLRAISSCGLGPCHSTVCHLGQAGAQFGKLEGLKLPPDAAGSVQNF